MKRNLGNQYAEPVSRLLIAFNAIRVKMRRASQIENKPCNAW